jgi:hypothetical protein
VLGDVGGEQADDVDVLGVLRGDDDGVEADGLPSTYSMVTCVLPSGRR